ncbi:MAG: hypothetical protein ACEPOZ_17635 [Marinifilaceae bacterium]
MLPFDHNQKASPYLSPRYGAGASPVEFERSHPALFRDTCSQSISSPSFHSILIRNDHKTRKAVLF